MELRGSPGRHPIDRGFEMDEQRARNFNEMTREALRHHPVIYNRPLDEVRKERATWAAKSTDKRARWISVTSSLRARVLDIDSPRGVCVHLHGGGWVLGGADQQDRLLASISDGTGLKVLSVDYRLAPENPFPAALDDATRVLEWVIDQSEASIESPHVLITGESAGANLAVGALRRLRAHRRFKRIVGACLNYGTFEIAGTPSMLSAAADTPFLSPALGAWFARHYVCRSLYGHPEVSPLHADLANLPRALFLVGSCDPVLDDSRLMHARWNAAGSRSDLCEITGGLHGLLEYDTPVTRYARCVQVDFIRSCLDHPE